MKEKEFNGYSFGDKKHRKHMKYVVITDGDLDLNNAYAFKSKRALTHYLKNDSWKEVKAVFAVTDITSPF